MQTARVRLRARRGWVAGTRVKVEMVEMVKMMKMVKMVGMMMGMRTTES